jgi:hypothetical protein
MILAFQVLDLHQCRLHVLFNHCIVLVSALAHILNECLQVLFGLRFAQSALFLYDVLFDILEGTFQLLDIFSLGINCLVKLGNLIPKLFLLFLELFLFHFPLFVQLVNFLFQFFAVGSVLGCSLLALCTCFAYQ